MSAMRMDKSASLAKPPLTETATTNADRSALNKTESVIGRVLRNGPDWITTSWIRKQIGVCCRKPSEQVPSKEMSGCISTPTLCMLIALSDIAQEKHNLNKAHVIVATTVTNDTASDGPMLAFWSAAETAPPAKNVKSIAALVKSQPRCKLRSRATNGPVGEGIWVSLLLTVLSHVGSDFLARRAER